jgi:hypothetical protein
MDTNIAGAGLHMNGGAAAIQGASDVMVIERALHHHLVFGGHRP